MYIDIMVTYSGTERSKFFVCEHCDYKSCRQSQFDRHLLTRKHNISINVDSSNQKNVPKNYACKCGKTYKHRQSLSVHRKKCTFSEENIENIKNTEKNINDEDIDDELAPEIQAYRTIITHDTILTLVNENNDIKKLLLEQQKQIVEQQKQIGELIPKIGNTINNTANIKQKFNINIFLNEKCKDALNIDDFIKQLQLTLDNLDLTKQKGLSEGLSNIFIENMNKLSLYERPLHCTDMKRDTLYIKDNDSWEKDKDKSKIKDAIKNLNRNHFKLIREWMIENPDFRENDQKQDYFAHLLKTCGADIDNISDKVVKKICISTHLKDELKDLDEYIIE